MPEESDLLRSLTVRPLASRFARLAAVTFDLGVWLALCYAAIAFADQATVTGAEKEKAREDTAGWLVLLVSGFLALVQVILLSVRGQSLGKLLMGIRVVLAGSEKSPGFMGAVVFRILVPGVIAIVPLAGPVFSVANILFIFGKERRCLHDRIAWTKVVRV